MKRLSKLTLCLLLATMLLSALPCWAQRVRGPLDPDKIIRRMSRRLELRTDQVSQIRAIFEQRQGRLQSLREQMQSTFTSEQRQALEEMKERRLGGGPRLTRQERRARFAELGFTREQRQQMRQLRAELREEREAIRLEMIEVLDEKQKARFQEMRSRRRRTPRGRRAKAFPRPSSAP